MSTFDASGRIPPDKGVIVSCFGKKGSGKSLMALQIFRSYPYDRMVLDIAGDDGPIRPDDPTIVRIEGSVKTDSLPEEWPEHLRPTSDGQHRQVKGKVPMTLVYTPDPGSPTHIDDMDHMVGIAFRHGGCCLLVHEVGVLTTGNRTPPNTRRVLMHNRHHALTAIFCGPRPADIDTLVLAQSNLVYCYEMPNRDDRDRVADTCGCPRDVFTEAMEELGPHEYLLYDAGIPKPPRGEEDRRLVPYAALPDDVVKSVERWAFPGGRPDHLNNRR